MFHLNATPKSSSVDQLVAAATELGTNYIPRLLVSWAGSLLATSVRWVGVVLLLLLLFHASPSLSLCVDFLPVSSICCLAAVLLGVLAVLIA